MKLRRCEVRAGLGGCFALPRYLNDADGLVAEHYRRTHDLLDGITALCLSHWHALENGRMWNNIEVIDDLGAHLAASFRGQGTGAGKRNLSDGAERIGREKSQRFSIAREPQDG